jgi:hypothetical protein
MPTRFSLPHIDISPFITSQEYQGAGSGGSNGIRDRVAHGQRLQQELAAALALADALRSADDRLEVPTGTYVEVGLRPGAKADTLDSKSNKIRSGAVNLAESNERIVAVFVPDAARASLSNILNAYLTGELTKGGNPPNQGKVEAIEAFRAARLETFWTDAPTALPAEPHLNIWWGIWCWRGAENEVLGICQRLDLRVAEEDRWLFFPETVVLPVFADRRSIELMLFGTSGIAELRRGSDSPAFFVDEVRGEQLPWVEDMAERVTWPASDAPAVCLFDTGVNRGHALIEPALAAVDMHAVNAFWGVDDHSGEGHGTSMAGLALHGDLTPALSDSSVRRPMHRLESAKILPPRGFDVNDPRNYGPITQAAIARAEISAPERARVFCLAITNDDVSGARPSAWSAALDQAAAGTMIGDDKSAPKRLLVVSAGNIKPEVDFRRIRLQDEFPAEDPAQAWNVLTVGGYTDLIDVQEADYRDWTPLVSAGEVSPHSRTSVTYPRNAPFKPEIVMEAGNRGVNPARTEVLTFPSLSLCSTGSNTTREPIVAFQATSAATAQAARLATRIAADHPEFWPETIRGLIVHSAEWTPPMMVAIKACFGKEARYECIRRFGYGVPNYERATASAKHHLAMFAQAAIQPFKLQGERKFNECHYYDLPFPRRMLEELENAEVQLKVTLSYFIDPNPGMSANIDPQRYQSHGLRFDLRRRFESHKTFKQRVNASEREHPRVGPAIIPDDERWVLGAKSVSAGSLHCDVWTGPAIELVGRDTLCIKPVGGWCRDRSTPEFCNANRRYALIVTLKCDDAEIDIYTPIRTHIDLPTSITI